MAEPEREPSRIMDYGMGGSQHSNSREKVTNKGLDILKTERKEDIVGIIGGKRIGTRIRFMFQINNCSHFPISLNGV